MKEEDAVRHPFLKVWDLGNADAKTGGPILLRSAKVQSGNRPHPVRLRFPLCVPRRVDHILEGHDHCPIRVAFLPCYCPW